MKPWERLSTETLNRNRWTEFRHDTFRLPNGSVGDYYYVHTPGAVTCIPVREDGKILVIRQHRYLFERPGIELPGGGIQDGLDAEASLQAELSEELGLRANSVQLLGRMAPSNGFADELQHIYLAWDLEPAVGEPEDTEEIEVLALTPKEIDAAIQSGEVWDGFSAGCWALARPHVVELLHRLALKKESQ